MKQIENLPELLSALETEGVTLLVGANWCGPCKRFRPHFEKAEAELSDEGFDTDFRAVYIDDVAGADEGSLANILGIQHVPTVFHFTSDDTLEVKSQTVLPLIKEMKEIYSNG